MRNLLLLSSSKIHVDAMFCCNGGIDSDTTEMCNIQKPYSTSRSFGAVTVLSQTKRCVGFF